MPRKKSSAGRLDDAARAGWLYYIAGQTQEEVAAAMGISRQVAQRLVSLAVEARLVRFWMDHPIAACLDLAARLRDRFGLLQAEVVPTVPGAGVGSDDGTVGLGEAGAAEITRWLKAETPIVMAVGTGRTLKAAIDNLPPIDCPQHRIVSMTGNIAPDGTAAYFNVIFSMAEVVEARHFPFPLPVFVSSEEERRLMHGQAMIRATLDLAAAADVAFVGIGQMDEAAPLFVDGFISRDELVDVQVKGAAGEICGWIYDAKGVLLDGATNARTASAPVPPPTRCRVIALAKGKRKVPAIRAALEGRLINGLITDEATARALLVHA
jgi:DNA-binding transcriptional regulator LsrR (DeoR family)